MNIMRKNRNTLRIFLMALLAMTFVSCEKGKGEYGENIIKRGNSQGEYSLTISAGKKGEEEATRAFLDLNGGAYYWQAGDKVGLTITPYNSTTPVANNVQMTGENTEQVLHTTFSGTLTSTQMAAMSSENRYDYYSYFPYSAGIVGSFPNIQFPIPSTITVKANEFNPQYAPMAAGPRKNESPILYLNGQAPAHGELIHFDYKHVISYAAIEMDCNLFQQQKITSITITSNGSQLWGIYNYNMATETGASGYTGGGNTLTINITDGGLTVGNGDVIYIPMPPVDMSAQDFTFQFTGAGTNYVSKTIKGANFEKGKIHRLRIAPTAINTGTTNFTTTVEGYYYIEAWGGNGGAGYGGTSGGVSQKVSGLYYLPVGTAVNVCVGTAGSNGASTGSGAAAAGGTNGSSYGNGGAGGNGGTGGGGPGGKGGAGGAGTIIFMQGMSSSNIRLVSGGAGGGGGYASASFGDYPPGVGGNGGVANSLGSNGGNAGGAQGGAGALGAIGGEGASNGGPGGNADGNGNGGAGAVGENGSGLYTSGGGAGGGAGGYTSGGGGGESGGRSRVIDVAGGGGGGAGGASYLTGTVGTPAGYTLPLNSRPTGRADGYVVITFLR